MSYHSVNAEHINPFIEAVHAVFRTMLNMNLERGRLYLKQGLQPSHEISGIIGLTGAAKGTVLLGMGAQVALKATGILAGEHPSHIDAMVIDAVGELTNMVAGSAKAKLEQLRLSVSLPSVIAGRNHSVSFPTGATPIGIGFESEYGPLSLEVSLVDAEQAETTVVPCQESLVECVQ
jgi:chemotaxis protein CheX